MKYFLALLFTASVLCGATVDFRSGKVLRAELSTVAPAGLKLINPIYSDLPANPVYAAVTILFNPGRSISLHDYAIHIFGRNYPCAAILKEGSLFAIAEETKGKYASGRFDWKKEESTSPNTRYTLFFILESSEISSAKGQTESLIFKPLFPPSETFEKKLNFNNLGSTPFTAPGRVPRSGLMKEQK